MSRPRPYQRPVLAAVLSTLGLVVVSAAIYTGLWFVDFGTRTGGVDPLSLFGHPDAAGTVAGLGEVTVAVLGIAITVVAIIVELAANRYTPRITELFIRDPINASVLSFFAVTSVLVLATAMSLYGPVYPSFMVTVVVSAMLLSMTAILPYFLYVFDFLTPRSVILRIQRRALDGIALGSRDDALVPSGRSELTNGVEQLGDVALNSIGKKDKAIAIATLNALSEVAEHSLASRSEMPERWYETESLANDQDFVSFHPDITRRVTHRRTWVEMKVLRQFQGVFGESLHDMQDVAHIVAIHTRSLAILAIDTGELHAIRLCLRFIHTYFRQAINDRDVRTAYNVFNEYRTLGEALLGTPYEDLVLEMADRARFYGQLAFKRQLPFILETAAYDVCALLELAFDKGARTHDGLLDCFLELDREPDGGEHQEASLRGVRKAQTKLATFYLMRGEEALARRIFEDMRHEPPERLRSIREELAAIEEPEFWEVSDRGVDFDWLPPDQRAQLATYFSWFSHLKGGEAGG